MSILNKLSGQHKQGLLAVAAVVSIGLMIWSASIAFAPPQLPTDEGQAGPAQMESQIFEWVKRTNGDISQLTAEERKLLDEMTGGESVHIWGRVVEQARGGL